jgi:hypothetical protein
MIERRIDRAVGMLVHIISATQFPIVQDTTMENDTILYFQKFIFLICEEFQRRVYTKCMHIIVVRVPHDEWMRNVRRWGE